jgi:tRNA threonylcarbamoyladenosine modification (KEOPS) complex  Pcc1 subunit
VSALEAKIVLQYEDERFAEAICKAVSPDNFKTPKGLRIETSTEANQVVTHIRHKGKFATFIATIDDLLFSASVAERTVQTTKQLE